MGHSLSLYPLISQGCCQSHPLLFQFVLDSLLSCYCTVVTGNQKGALQELIGAASEDWLGKMGSLAKFKSYSALYAQQTLPWKKPAVDLAKLADNMLQIAIRCQTHPKGGTLTEWKRLKVLMTKAATLITDLIGHYQDDERVLLLLVRRQDCLARLFGANFLSSLLQEAHGSHEDGMQLLQERLRARGYETHLATPTS